MTTKAAVSFYEVFTRPNPAVGTEFTVTAPGGDACRLVSLAFVLATSAVVANRRIVLLADDQTDTWGVFPAVSDQAAAATVRYGAYGGAVGTGLATSALTVPLPDGGLVLLPGHRLRSATLNIDAGDQYSLVRGLWQRFPQGPVDEWLPTVDTQIFEMG